MNVNKLYRYRGDTYSIKATLTRNDVPVDFTVGHNTAEFSFARGTVRTTIPGAYGTVNGEISFPFPGDINPGEYIYDIQVKSSSGEIRTFIKDVLIITDDITAP